MARWSAPRRDRLSRSSTACCTSACGKVTDPVGPSSVSTPSPMRRVDAVEHLVAREAAGAGEHRDGGVGPGDRGQRDEARRLVVEPVQPSVEDGADRVGQRLVGRGTVVRELRHEERVATRGPVDGLGARPGVPAAGGEQLGDVAGLEPADGESVEEAVAVEVGAELLEVGARGLRARPRRGDEQHVGGPFVAEHVVEHAEGQLVGEVEVVEHEHERPHRRLGFQQVGHRLEQHVALGARPPVGRSARPGRSRRGRARAAPARPGPRPPGAVLRGTRSAARPGGLRRSARTGRSPRWWPAPTSRWRPRGAPPRRTG